MKRILLALAGLFLFVGVAQAQNTTGLVVTTCGSPTSAFVATRPGPFTVDVNGLLCDGASAATAGGASVSSTIIPNNTTAVVVKGSPGQLYGVECFNNSATIAYIKIYNAISATAGSGTPNARFMCPASTSGAGFVLPVPVGSVYSTGITFVMTTGIADNDTGAPAANTYIVNVRYK